MKTVSFAGLARARTFSRALGFLMLLSVSMPGHTNAVQPPWLQPDVLRAALELKMSEEQLPDFREALTKLVQGHQTALNRVLSRNNASNMKQKMKSAINRQFIKFDKAMFKILDESQHEQYATYRKLLKARLSNTARNSGTTNSRDAGQINSALDGFSASN